MSTDSTRVRLESITKDLVNHWRTTRDSWLDAKAREFESKYIEELAANVDRAVTVIEKLNKQLEKIRKDCE